MSEAEPPLYPISWDWQSPSLIWGKVALCRDRHGKIWFCTLAGEGEGWERGHEATEADIEAFRWSQKLAGKDISRIPL